VCGFSQHKDVTAMLHHLATSPNVKAIFPVTSPHFKLQSIDTMKSKFAEVTKLVHPYVEESKSSLKEPIDGGDIALTLTHVTKEAAKNKDVVLICGSFYIMSDVRSFYKYLDEFDPSEVNSI
jgi:folylpolyglutamate synthase/dihydropteroate synthase